MKLLALSLAAFDAWLVGLLLEAGAWIHLFAAAGLAMLGRLLWSARRG